MSIRSCIEHVISRALLKAEDRNAVGISALMATGKKRGGAVRRISICSQDLDFLYGFLTMDGGGGRGRKDQLHATRLNRLKDQEILASGFFIQSQEHS